MRTKWSRAALVAVVALAAGVAATAHAATTHKHKPKT